MEVGGQTSTTPLSLLTICRLYFYVEFAFACALLILAFIFVEESAYKRVTPPPPTPEADSEKHHTERIEMLAPIPPRKSFVKTLKPWSGVDHEAEFFMTMLRSFSYFLVPSVMWVVTSFGKPSSMPIPFPNANTGPRHLHRSGRPNLQLHLPHQDRRTALQLESKQQRPDRPGQHNRLRARRTVRLVLGPHRRLADQTQ